MSSSNRNKSHTEEMNLRVETRGNWSAIKVPMMMRHPKYLCFQTWSIRGGNRIPWLSCLIIERMNRHNYRDRHQRNRQHRLSRSASRLIETAFVSSSSFNRQVDRQVDLLQTALHNRYLHSRIPSNLSRLNYDLSKRQRSVSYGYPFSSCLEERKPSLLESRDWLLK